MLASTVFRRFASFNPLLCTDVYKSGHLEQYKRSQSKTHSFGFSNGPQQVYSYLQARSAKTFDRTLWFGLQYYLDEYLSKPITLEHSTEFINVLTQILGPVNPEVEAKVNALGKLGYWPLRIKAVDEGTLIRPHNVLMSITNTHPDFYWTVGFVESLLLKVWFSCTVATASFEYRKVMEKYLAETSDNVAHKKFLVHDFGYRSDSSEESSVISGMAHLVSFDGSDTVPAHNGLIKYYGAQPNCTMKSVPASEHSVMCSFGRTNEVDAFKHMINTYPTGIVSIVSDTYDIWNVLTNFARVLKPDILKRQGKVVFRPDSGNPEHIICGDPLADPSSPAGKGAIRLLDEVFGSEFNSKGYKVLHPNVGLIYGDGMYIERYTNILERLKKMGYASSNLVIGVGSLLRYFSRDTLGFALKASNVRIDGTEYAIMKDPITDQKKRSHQGYLHLTKDVDNEFVTLSNVSQELEQTGLLKTVFENGKVIHRHSIQDIRAMIDNQF